MAVKDITCVGAVLLVCACGDNQRGPQPLVEDPAVATGCLPDAPAEGTSRAKRIECAAELVFDPEAPGLLVAGRQGDILLDNARVKVIVRAQDEGFLFPASSGGTIVDAALRGRDDQLKELIPLVELSQAASDEVVIVEAGDDGPAEIVVRGPATSIPLLAAAVAMAPPPVIAETHYVLEPDSDTVIIRTRLFGDSAGDPPTVRVGDLFFVGGSSTAFVPGIGRPQGLAYGEFIASHGPSVSYAIAYPADTSAVQLIDIANVTGALGPQATAGSGQAVERWLVIGDGPVSSVATGAWALRGVATGQVLGTTAPDVDIVVTDTGDRPITIGRSDAAGEFSLTLPPGSYSAHTESPARPVGEARQITVTAGGSQTVDLPAGGSGTLEVTSVDDAGTALPARVVVHIGDDRRIHYTDASGALRLPLPPGSYTVDVSRGVEYDAFTADVVTIADGATERVTATLSRVIDTAGWIAIDTHVHSEMSLDSTVPLIDRLRSIAAEGVEIALSTDHDFITDYAPVIEHLGLSDWLAYRTGVESSPLVYGHTQAWPVVADYTRGGGGAFAWYDVGPDRLFAQMRAAGPDLVIQINHPRKRQSGFFEYIDFDPDLGRGTQDPAALGYPDSDFSDFNFDAVEVANSFSVDEFTPSFDDWLSLVAHGHPAAATGSSDSHGPGAFIGNSRTYVYVGPGNDDPRTVDLAAVDEALKQRKVVVSQGAFVTAAIADPATAQPAPPGAMVDLSGQTEATVHLRIQAPPWMPLARVRVFADRVQVQTIVLDPADTAVIRFDQTVTLPITGDGFFVFLVEPAGPGTPVLSTPVGSFTNPLLFDADGDGEWTPPAQ